MGRPHQREQCAGCGQLHAGPMRLVQGPRRNAMEVAKLGKGDIINGLSMLGRKPEFHVIAHTKVGVSLFVTKQTTFMPRPFG